LFVLEVSCHLYNFYIYFKSKPAVVVIANYAQLSVCKVSCSIKLFTAIKVSPVHARCKPKNVI